MSNSEPVSRPWVYCSKTYTNTPNLNPVPATELTIYRQVINLLVHIHIIASEEAKYP